MGSKNNNFAHFRRELEIRAIREFGKLGNLIKTSEYYEPPAVEYDPDELDPTVDHFGFYQKQVNAMITERVKTINAMNENRPRLAALIWGNLSIESKQKIEEHDDWENIQNMDDPLLLWKAIIDTHQNSILGDKLLDLEHANAQYINIAQQPFESLADYKRRFDDCLDRLEALGVVKEPPEMAIHFITKLDNYRYGEFKTRLHDNVGMNAANYPTSLTDAFAVVSRCTLANNNRNKGILMIQIILPILPCLTPM